MSNISVDYDVLNQRGSPAWFSDIYANIPTAGYKGRMFISIDTYAFYRDTGTGWDLIGGPGTGTITGSGATGQVSFFNGSSTLAGNNNLFWDNTNSRLGIGTITPGTILDVHGTANVLVQLNNTTTGNSNIAFQNQDVAKWRIGNVYNGGANSFDLYNVSSTSTIFSVNSNNTFTFSSSVFANFGIALKDVSGVNSNGNLGLGSTGAGLSLGMNVTTTNYFVLPTSVGYSYTFPATTGTLALTSNIPANIVTGTGVNGQVAYWNGTSTQTGSNNFLYDSANQSLTFLGLNSSRFEFSNGKFSSTRTSAAINLTFSAENRQTPAADVGSSYGFYGGNTGNNPIAEIKAAWEGASINNSYFTILTTLSGNSSEKLRLTSAGYLGINTISPAYFLDVAGTGRFTGQLLLGSTITNGTYTYTLPSATGTFALTSNLSSYLPLTGGTLSGSLAFSGSGSAPATGIGLRYDGTEFYIYPGANYFNIRNNANTRNNLSISDSGQSTFYGDSGSIVQRALTTGAAQFWGINNAAGSSRSYIGYGGISSSAFSIVNYENGNISFATNSITRMYISSAGNLTIGTATDNGQKLQVSGQVQATGSVNLSTSDIVYATGTTTIFTITSEVNSHYLVVGHDPNSTGIYASAIVIVNGTGTISNVINLGSLGGLTITGTGTSVQMVNIGGAANGRNSIIRMR